MTEGTFRPGEGRWLPSDGQPTRERALAILCAQLAGDRQGAAELVASFDGDPVALADALHLWVGVLVANAGAPVADELLTVARGTLLRLSGRS